MFKNAIFYRTSLNGSNAQAIGDMVDAVHAFGAFAPCAPTQLKSTGWVPPRAEFGLLIENVNRQLILKLMTEVRVVPTDAVTRAVEAQRKHVEQTTGRKPGKKQTKEIKEEVMLTLLPTALTRRSAVLASLDLTTGMLMVDTASQARADEVVTLLVKASQGLLVQSLDTADSPSKAMAGWLLSGDAPNPFSVDRECELKSRDEMKSIVRYGRHALDSAEVRAHIDAGKAPTKLALTWDGRVSFVLTDCGKLKKLEFLGGVFAGRTQSADQFDANVAIATGELKLLLADLVDAMGGYQVVQAAEEALA